MESGRGIQEARRGTETRTSLEDRSDSMSGTQSEARAPSTTQVEPEIQADRIRSQGFTVFDSLYTASEVDELRGSILRRVDELNPPTLWSRQDRPFVDGVELAPTGLAFTRLLPHCPHLAPLLLKPSVLETLRRSLGAEPRLELVGAVVSDEVRPFFPWHSHVNGGNDSIYRRQGWPDKPRVERVLTLLYLDDIDDDSGVLLVHPRAEGAPTSPPQDPYLECWEGQVEVRVPRGSVVALEQCTWHAARPRRTPGRRVFIACYFRSGDVPEPDWVDRSLASFADRDPLFASLIGTNDTRESPSP